MNNSKIQEAKNVIQNCIGRNGVWAGSKRYQYQCWTRDFVVSLRTLLGLGCGDICRKHFSEIFKRQLKSGEIPVLYADSWLKLFLKKVFDAIKKRRISFVLRKMVWPGLSRLSPGTRDVEALAILGVINYAEIIGDKKILDEHKERIEAAVCFMENTLADKNGLIRGADWRDMLEDQLKDKTLLSNNAVLYEMYRKLGRLDKAENIKKQVNDLFWNGSYYRGYPESKDFDTYGQSLAILFGIVPPERHPSIISKYKNVSMPFGFRINDIFPKPTTPEEEKAVQKIMKTTNQFAVVWPYINAFAILALKKVGENDLADEQWRNWNRLNGFNEWYDPETGQGFGDIEQLWSAALYLQVAKELGEISF